MGAFLTGLVAATVLTAVSFVALDRLQGGTGERSESASVRLHDQ